MRGGGGRCDRTAKFYKGIKEASMNVWRMCGELEKSRGRD